MFMCSTLAAVKLSLVFFLWAAETQAEEEIPIISLSNIKEFKYSFSNEKFDFHSNPNIAFHVYVSDVTWPVTMQVHCHVRLILHMTEIMIGCRMNGLKSFHWSLQKSPADN